MGIPHLVLIHGWIPFVVVIFVIFVFSWIYVRYYQDHLESELSTTITSIIALTITLVTSALVPLDIFLVSYMKNTDGTFKSWAANLSERSLFEDNISYTYYGLYSVVILFLFLILPFMYFYFEEQDDDVTCKMRMCGAMKYTLVFILAASIILLIGSFVPLKHPPKNVTEWDDKLNYLKNEIKTSHGETALTFTIGLLTFVGLLSIISYTAYGMSVLPLELIKGYRSIKDERYSLNARRENLQSQINLLTDKYVGKRRMSSRDRSKLTKLEDEERLIGRRQGKLADADAKYCKNCFVLFRPFQIVLGIFLFLLALLIVVSLIITGIDKALHSLGYKYGYSLPDPKFVNPVNKVMLYAQLVFPVDYCLFFGIVFYFVFCTMVGMRKTGIRFFCLKLYKIRPRKTLPQALLFFVFILMYVVLAINVILMSLAPQYLMYGNQKYQIKVFPNTTRTGNTTTHGNFTTKTYDCSTKVSNEHCTMSRISVLLSRFFYKVWFFGVCDFWGTWVFLLAFAVGLLVSCCKGRRSYIGDMDSSDDESSNEYRSIGT
ncbi:probable lysosomal cobalamin transporter [Dendronephthya gigantea]|uniref:probable lysosomal cobalamin transporter n=1 Tax=Dendronephthya gigantea TaxID=151771 RepID=UPI00106C367B|nr:probable lysosomal cobalamin transporter [Dendronephthya gigantea]